MEFTKEQKIFQTIVQKAWEDATFKQELLANPIQAIENLTGKRIKLPNNKTIIVRDQTDQTVKLKKSINFNIMEVLYYTYLKF